MAKIEDELIAIRHRAWSTAGARYNAARRLRMRSRLSLATISLISAIGVSVPLILSTDLAADKENLLNLYAALLSLFILVVAVIEGASGFDVKADALHRNAEALTAFRTRIGVALACSERHTVEVLDDFASEYEQILGACGINHDSIDFELFQANKPGDFQMNPSRGRLFIVRWKHRLHSTLWLLAIGVISISLLIALLAGDFSLMSVKEP
ncbi:SLATT domain-containing protein [Lysobacter olei]